MEVDAAWKVASKEFREKQTKSTANTRESRERKQRDNQRMSKRNLCLEFLWLDHNNKYK